MNDGDNRHALFAEYTSGDMTSERFHMLEMSLRKDATLRSEFIEYMNLDAALGDLAALSESEVAEFERLAHSKEARLQDVGAGVAQIGLVKAAIDSRFRSVIALFGTLAAALLIIAAVWITGSNSNHDRTLTDSHQPVAELVTRVDAVLKRDSAVWGQDNLPVGEFQLARGLVHLRFAGGVTVFIEAPTTFDVVSAKRVALHNGRLSANVPNAGTGFTVETPEVEVIDFGTEFSVDVEGGASEVHVFDGLVRVHPGASQRRGLLRSVDLQASQAVRITDASAEPEDISIATDRFIRNFNEPKWNYARLVKRLKPLAIYRMPIRDRGLVSEPPEYSGVVLTGDGKRPPHARGVFVGGSLRVGADSTGRGGRVDAPPVLSTGQFSLTGFVYLEARARSAVVVTNLDDGQGNFSLSLDEKGRLQATIRNGDGDVSCSGGSSVLPRETWRHVVVTADAERLHLYEDGKLVASTHCAAMTASDSETTVWFGTDPRASQVWDGRIDELALFDRALNENEIAALYRTAQQEMARSR